MIVLMRRTLLAATLAAALAGCSNNEAPTDPLAYVPTDSPYVMANHTPTPKAVVQAWLAMYGDNMEEIYADMANDPELKAIEGEFGEWVRAAMPEFGKMTSVDGIEELGLKAEGRFAAYGYGLMPVYRMELSDSKNLAATIARIEERAGKKLAKRKLGETELWQFANDKAVVLFGAVGNFLVVTLAPAKADDARLSAQVGLTLPEASMATNGAFAELDKKYGYDGHLSGYIDIRALAQRLSGRNQDDNQVISAFGGEVPKLSDACAGELDLMTQKFPRMVFGTTRFDEKQMNVGSLIEVEPELAKSMQKIAAPIPGAGSNERDDAAFCRIGGPAGNRALPQWRRRFDRRQALPVRRTRGHQQERGRDEAESGQSGHGDGRRRECAALRFEEHADGSRQRNAERGVRLLTLGSSSPLMLWGLAQQGVPALAQIQLAADGKIVALPADALPMPIPLEFKAVMTDKSIGVATTDIDDASFTAAATVPASADGTVLRYGFTGDFFKLIAEQVPAPTPEMDEKAAKDAERGRKMIAGMGEKIGQMDVRMQLTARGIEFVQENTLK